MCRVCYRSSSHKVHPTLTPEFKTTRSVSKERKCNVCRQGWVPIKIVRDSPHGRWMEVRVRPKIPSNIDYQLCKSCLSKIECLKGLECSFAHSKTELAVWNSERQLEPRPAPPISGPYQYQLCKHKMNTGSCPYGQRCTFAHTEEELRQWLRVQAREVSAATYVPQEIVRVNELECSVCGLTCTSAKQLEDHFAGSRHHKQTMNKPPGQYTVPFRAPLSNFRRRPTLAFPINGYKMCLHVNAGRRCVYGDFCTFAHTPQELEAWNQQLHTTERVRAPSTIARYLNTGERRNVANVVVIATGHTLI